MISIDLTGRTALVTGASGGVWSAVAERFAEAGATVVGPPRPGRRRCPPCPREAGTDHRRRRCLGRSHRRGCRARLFDPSGAGPLSVRCAYRDPDPSHTAISVTGMAEAWSGPVRGLEITVHSACRQPSQAPHGDLRRPGEMVVVDLGPTAQDHRSRYAPRPGTRATQ
jgi:NAD(P)-dependent dehydrogenase (short-subunit alcohol dehydrogenase family)